MKFGGAAGYRPLVRSAYYERVYVHSSKERLMFKQILLKFKDLNQKSENIFYGASFIFFFLFEE